jgi:hypothetical protein
MYYCEVRDALGELLRNWGTPVFNMKYKDSLHPLSDLSIEAWVDFYTHLTADLKYYHIGLVPFDAIVLKAGYIGVVLPGVGDDRYLPMARVLYNILEHLLPVDNPTIRMCNNSASGLTMDGFRWLHGILTEFVPGFSPYMTATPPLWQDVRDISKFAKLYISLYYRLLGLQAIFHAPVARSRAFLLGIDEESLRPSIISLQTGIVNYTNSMVLGEFDDVIELPTHFTIDGLAASLIKSSTSFTGNMSLAYPSTSTTTFSTFGATPMDNYPFTFGRPYSVTANYTSRPRPPQQRSNFRERRPAGRGNDQRDRSHRRQMSNDKSTASDDHVYCDACSEKHPVERCWKVARALIIQRFIKSNLGKDILTRIKKAYTERFNPKPSAGANATSAAFLEAYCADSGLLGQDVAESFDWDWLASEVDDWQDTPESN